jgi:ParB-like nuclease domain
LLLLDKQLDLLGGDAVAPESLRPLAKVGSDERESSASSRAAGVGDGAHGQPLILPISALEEDPTNPRTEFPESELDELADDIRQHGILQPIVVHLADANGR